MGLYCMIKNCVYKFPVKKGFSIFRLAHLNHIGIANQDRSRLKYHATYKTRDRRTMIP